MKKKKKIQNNKTICQIELHVKHYYSTLAVSRIMIQVPSGSTCLAICRASEVAKSVLAGVTAKIRHVSLVINWNSMSLI